MPFRDNPALEGIMGAVDILVDDAEQKRRERAAERLMLEKEERAWDRNVKKEQLGLLDAVIGSDDFAPESRGTAYSLKSKALESGEYGIGDFTPQFRETPQSQPVLLEPGIAQHFGLDPNIKWDPEEAAMIGSRYKDDVGSEEGRKNLDTHRGLTRQETKRHNLQMEKKKPGGGGFNINIGGKRVNADKAMELIDKFEKDADGLFKSGYKGKSTFEGPGMPSSDTKPVNRDAYDLYKKKLTEYKRAIQNDKVTPEMMEEINNLDPFVVEEKAYSDVKNTENEILKNSAERLKILKELNELK